MTVGTLSNICVKRRIWKDRPLCTFYYLTIEITSGLCKIAPYCVATVGKGGSNLRLDDDDQHCGHGSTLITAEEKSPFFFFIVVFQGNGRAAAAYAHTLRNY